MVDADHVPPVITKNITTPQSTVAVFWLDQVTDRVRFMVTVRVTHFLPTRGYGTSLNLHAMVIVTVRVMVSISVSSHAKQCTRG